MNEITFIKTNKKNWERLSKIAGGELSGSVSETVELYTQTADDLAYARTHYTDSKVITYLNAVVLNAHRLIYKNKYGNWAKLRLYWTVDIPLAVYRQRRNILAGFAIFFIAIAIGWFSSAVDENFCRTILGDSYVNMTIENIDKGDPMAVYGTMKESNMFFRIGINNIYVAFLAFMLGMFTSLGPGFILLSNGVMVGAFFYFFYEKGLAAITWSTIMIHGTLELSAIAIAGGAGLVLGNSFLFPGTYTRMRSLINGASDGIKIMAGLIPVFIAAAFLESYMTREYQVLTMLSRLLIIISSLAFLVWYFIIYSNKIHERFQTHTTPTGSRIWTSDK